MTAQLMCWQVIKEHGPLSATQICLKAGLCYGYVKTIVRDLRSRGCIETTGPNNSKVHTAVRAPFDRRGKSVGAAENRAKGRRVYAAKARQEYAMYQGRPIVLPPPATELERCWPMQ